MSSPGDKHFVTENWSNPYSIHHSENRKGILANLQKNSLKNDKVKTLFPLNKTKHCMKKRKQQKYQTKKQNTNRYKKSALPNMRKLLNNDNERNEKILKTFSG